MKLKLIIGIMTFLLMVISLLFYLKDDASLEIISRKAIHSYFQSSKTESFDIEVLTNDPDDYHFTTEYLTSSSIQSNDESDIIPITITDITTEGEVYIYQGNPYHHMYFEVKVAFDSPDYEIMIPNAYLTLTYSNNETVKLAIGEFHYRFYHYPVTQVLLGSIQTTVMKLGNVSSVSGIAIELSNNASENILIKGITLGSKKVSANNFYMTELPSLPPLFSTPADVLGLDFFNYLAPANEYAKNVLLREHQSAILYIPFQYDSKQNYLHRFYCSVLYEIDGETHSLIIDDFPYIRTDFFQKDLESEFISYVIHHQD